MPSSGHNAFVLRPMTEEAARVIAAWQYTGEYAVYNADGGDVEATVRSFLEPAFDYHEAWHTEHGLAAFCCFGEDAQVPGGDYASEAIDVGLGMRPDLVGHGLGRGLLKAALSERGVEGAAFRATIAAFNGRSRHLFERAGFVEEQRFTVDAPRVRGRRLDFVVVRRPAKIAPNYTGPNNTGPNNTGPNDAETEDGR